MRTNDPSTAQPDLRRLAVPGVRFFRFRDPHFQADAFHLGTVVQGGGDAAAGFFAAANPAADLVECCETGGGCCEGAVVDGLWFLGGYCVVVGD